MDGKLPMTDLKQVREALAPCPFCGNTIITEMFENTENAVAFCGQCGCEFNAYLWNDRTVPHGKVLVPMEILQQLLKEYMESEISTGIMAILTPLMMGQINIADALSGLERHLHRRKEEEVGK